MKRAIDGFKEDFRGYAQHDAMELVQAMVDSLHEDLNRVLKKEYVEIPDAGDRPDEVVAQENWDLHLKRNNSIVTDHMTGLLKSTVTCPQCETDWRKFDPVNTLEIELPLQSFKPLEVTLVRRFERGSDASPPMTYGISVERTTTMNDVRRQVAKLSGIDVERLEIWETYQNTLFQRFAPNELAFKLVKTDIIVATEVEPALPLRVFMANRQGPYRHQASNSRDKPIQQHFGVPLLLSVDPAWTIRY